MDELKGETMFRKLVKAGEIEVDGRVYRLRFYELKTIRGGRRFSCEVQLTAADRIILDDDSMSSLESKVERLAPATVYSRLLAAGPRSPRDHRPCDPCCLDDLQVGANASRQVRQGKKAHTAKQSARWQPPTVGGARGRSQPLLARQYGVLELLGDASLHDSLGGNLDGFPRCRVSAHSRLALLNNKLHHPR